MTFSNALLVAVSVLLTTAFAEGAVRLVDDLPLFTDWLPNAVEGDVTESALASVPLAPGVSVEWFRRDPPPLPNRAKPPAAWARFAEEHKDVPSQDSQGFRAADFFKVWNAAFLRDPCSHPVLSKVPGTAYLFEPVDYSPYPRFRYFPSVTTPAGLVTNEFGWRGPPIRLEKPENVIRIVFVGASTTANTHDYPYSYPELVGGWLNIWAASKRLNVRFETPNAARESISAPDMEAIVRNEVVPAHPELVVYLEGGNAFFARELIPDWSQPAPPEQKKAVSKPGIFYQILSDASNRSALARRVKTGLELINHPGPLHEAPKPDHTVKWPTELDARDPDLQRKDLPLSLPVTFTALDNIRAELSSIGSELALSSFKFFVRDGLLLDPVRNQALYHQLNTSLYPLTYRELEELARFKNLAYAKYARVHNLPFIDVARYMPDEADLYTDTVHLTYGGVRLHAWIVLQSLIPLIERKLAEKTWPHPAYVPKTVPQGLMLEPISRSIACGATP